MVSELYPDAPVVDVLGCDEMGSDERGRDEM